MHESSCEARPDLPGGSGPPPSITVLGRLAVRAGGRRVELGPPRQRAVFALLLINAGSVVPVESLVDRIWGDAPPGAAVATLQSYVSRLRRLLGGCVLPDGSTPALRYRQPGYTLGLAGEHTDAHRFERAAELGARLSRQERHQEAYTVLCRALFHWSGTPYEELSAYDFALQEANRLEQVRLGAVETWARCCLELGRDEEVVHRLKPEAERNPLRERLIGRLMQAQYRLGCQADALRTYEETRGVLAEELGTDPGRELAALHAAILRQDTGLDPACAAAPARPAPAAGPGPVAVAAPGPVVIHRPPSVRVAQAPAPARPVPRGTRPARPVPGPPPFVGRDDELRRLLESATGAFASSGRAVLVVGEAGSGKTRLLAELERSVPAGVPTVWASCSESEDRPDYWPWTTLLRNLYALRPERLRRLPVRLRRPLARLLPEVAPEPPGARDPAPGAHPSSRSARFTLHDAVCQALLRTVREPTVIVLEDMHRADAPSLALLRFVTEHLRTVPLLLVVTTRAFQLSYDAGLRRAAAVVLQSADALSLRLTTLDLRVTTELARGVLGRTPDPLLVRTLHSRSAGNPYFLVHLLRSLVPGRPRTWEAEIPDELAGVVLQRLSGVPAGVRRVLGICAVVEGVCERDAVEAVMRREGIPPECLLMAVHGGLLRSDPAGPGLLRFTHPLVREAVCYGMDNALQPAAPAAAPGVLATG
ncbi:BTAD domain-containing putative transcriptional regulator [Streptomyces sp. NPDC003691]